MPKNWARSKNTYWFAHIFSIESSPAHARTKQSRGFTLVLSGAQNQPRLRRAQGCSMPSQLCCPLKAGHHISLFDILLWIDPESFRDKVTCTLVSPVLLCARLRCVIAYYPVHAMYVYPDTCNEFALFSQLVSHTLVDPFCFQGRWALEVLPLKCSQLQC